MNNRAYNKAKEHLKDFTKFPTINDIVLLMEEQSRETAIEFSEWTYRFNWKLQAHPTDANQKVWVKSYWSVYDNSVWKTTEELYEQFLKEQENEENDKL